MPEFETKLIQQQQVKPQSFILGTAFYNPQHLAATSDQQPLVRALGDLNR
jgi:hypothetical protein